ncbi:MULTISPECIES: SIR2 family protein [unclassified Acinetobacter]|uniref:SIR2 family protein n=1 Tax=unclassified Acinetobacter TaxID=196816 RepID=UPI0015D25227
MDITESLKGIIKDSPTAPFLFIGSGFSRRYLGLEDWKGLLSKFGAKLPTGFIRYVSESNGDLALAAEKMAEPYSEYWWSLPTSEEIANRPEWHTHISSPLRHDICEYLNAVILDEKKHQEELNILTSKKTIIDGIITTNWDLLLENIFIDDKYKVYIGQSDLLFSNPQKIAEIYKIHGCCSDPKSLVLTKSDYEDFHKKNPYLAAKLLSIFLEHPILFIGYSLHDENIKSILCSISAMMTNDEHKQKLAKNLIFINRSHGDEDSISNTHFSFEEGKSIPITQIKTNDFGKIYLALQDKERKIPAHILRIFREQFYQIVQGESPEKKLYCPTDIDEIIKAGKEIEFVAGFGVAQNSYLGKVGIKRIDLEMVLKDLLFDDLKIDPNDMISCLSSLSYETTYLPIQKYLSQININKHDLGENLTKFSKRDMKFFKGKVAQSYQKSFKKNKFESIKHILGTNYADTGKVNYLCLFIIENPSQANILELRDYLISKFKDFKEKTEFKNLLCIYDLLKYKKTPQ